MSITIDKGSIFLLNFKKHCIIIAVIRITHAQLSSYCLMNQNCRFLNVALQHQWSYKIINITAHPAECLVFSVILLARSAYLFRRNFSLLKNKQQEYFFGFKYFLYFGKSSISMMYSVCICWMPFPLTRWCCFLNIHFQGEREHAWDVHKQKNIDMTFIYFILKFHWLLINLLSSCFVCVFLGWFFILLFYFIFGKAINDAVSKMQSEEKR